LPQMSKISAGTPAFEELVINLLEPDS
jgi:hypothetical protein